MERRKEEEAVSDVSLEELLKSIKELPSRDFHEHTVRVTEVLALLKAFVAVLRDLRDEVKELIPTKAEYREAHKLMDFDTIERYDLGNWFLKRLDVALEGAKEVI